MEESVKRIREKNPANVRAVAGVGPLGDDDSAAVTERFDKAQRRRLLFYLSLFIPPPPVQSVKLTSYLRPLLKSKFSSFFTNFFQFFPIPFWLLQRL